MGKFIDLTGQRFGRLVVLERVENNKYKSAQWLCRCDCGNQKIVVGYALRAGNTVSCGCRMRELNATRSIVHKASGTRLYRIWANMIKRCTNPNVPSYHNYGGRGITVCDEWRKFESFRDWALSHGYTDSLSIDRIDCDGSYESDNCRWATAKEQNNNTRRNRYLTAFGKTQTLAQWCKEYSIARSSLEARLNRGWSVEDALTTPVDKSRSTRKK